MVKSKIRYRISISKIQNWVTKFAKI